MPDKSKLDKFFHKIGPVKTTLIVTAFFTSASVLLCLGLSLAIWEKIETPSIFKAFLIPVILVPFLSLFFRRFILRLEEAERSLRKSEEKYRSVLQDIEDGYFEVDLSGSFTFFNERMGDMLGYSDEEMAGLNFRSFMDRKNTSIVMGVFNEVYKTGKSAKAIDWKLIRKDGQELCIETSVSLIRDRVGVPVGFRGITRDITERKNAEDSRRLLEERLQNSRRLESLEALAGGIAHDFNNLLMGIQGYVSLMLLDAKPSDPRHDQLKKIEKSVDKGEKLTRQLLGFAREGKYNLEKIDPGDLMEKAASMFARTQPQIAIRKEFVRDGWRIEGDRFRLEQVLIDLFVNAAQAMPHGGELLLSTRNDFFDAQKAESMGLSPGKTVTLSIADTGKGIDEKVLNHIFEPFFTTRTIGSGTGLGLASCYGIVRNHKGIIRATSVKGKGSTFRIYLPASEGESAVEEVPAFSIAAGRETILIVDDEEIVLEVGAKMLENLGYNVHKAKNGMEAVSIVEEHDDGIDLIVLDMTMPGLSGYETFEQLQSVNGRARVLLSSGYGLDSQISELVQRGAGGFIQKPFKLDELSGKVRSILDEPHSHH